MFLIVSLHTLSPLDSMDCAFSRKKPFNKLFVLFSLIRIIAQSTIFKISIIILGVYSQIYIFFVISNTGIYKGRGLRFLKDICNGHRCFIFVFMADSYILEKFLYQKNANDLIFSCADESRVDTTFIFGLMCSSIPSSMYLKVLGLLVLWL